jgi:hypothetical protein
MIIETECGVPSISSSMARFARPSASLIPSSMQAEETMLNRLLLTNLMFDPVQTPSLGHAFKLVSAAIPEADSRPRHQVLDRA